MTKNAYMVFPMTMREACRRSNANAEDLCTQGVWRSEGKHIEDESGWCLEEMSREGFFTGITRDKFPCLAYYPSPMLFRSSGDGFELN